MAEFSGALSVCDRSSYCLDPTPHPAQSCESLYEKNQYCHRNFKVGSFLAPLDLSVTGTEAIGGLCQASGVHHQYLGKKA